MKRHLLIIALTILYSINSNAQGIGPIPGSQIRGTSEILGGLMVDSLLKLPIRALTGWPYANNKMPTIGLLQVNSVDTLPYYLKSGSTWQRLLTTDDTSRFGKGSVTSVATGYGVTGGPITTTGTISVDSIIIATRLRLQKIVDSLGAIIATKGSGTITNVSGTAGRISSTGGTTPVIDLVTANPTPATSGSGTAIPIITYDAYGRLTAVTTVSPTNPTITLSGDVSGSGTTAITTTLTTVNASPGIFGSATAIPVITVDSKGRATTITTISPSSAGLVTSVSVISANGFTGTVNNPTSTPVITLTTTVNAAVVKGNGTALIPAISGTDYQAPGNYITALTGDVTAAGPGSAAATIANLTVTNAKIANATIDLTAKVTGLLPLANGGTNANLSATGGTHNFLKQSSTSAVITVGQPALTDLSDYTAMGTNGWSPTIVGYATPPTPDIAQYEVRGSVITVIISFTGTSNSSLCNFTLPFNSTITYRPQAVRVQNNSTVAVTFLEITSGSNVCVVHASPVDASGFSTSGVKSLITSFTYLK